MAPRRRWLRPRLALSLLAAAGVSAGLAFTALTTLGAFSAQIVNPNGTFSTGSIVLKESAGATNCLSTGAGTTITVANSYNCTTIDTFGAPTGQVAGGSNTQTLTFQNVGSTNASAFTVTPAACAAASAGGTYAGSDTAGFCGKVDVTIENDTGAATCLYPAQAGACPALSSTYTLSSLAGNGAISLGALNAGATDTIKFTTGLDSSADNSDQGLKATQQFTWTLNQ